MAEDAGAAEAVALPEEVEEHVHALRRGFRAWPTLAFGLPPAMGDARWTPELILAVWWQAETGRAPEGLEHRVGRSGGGFDVLGFRFGPPGRWIPEGEPVDLSLPLRLLLPSLEENERLFGIPVRRLFTVDGEELRPERVYREIRPAAHQRSRPRRRG